MDENEKKIAELEKELKEAEERAGQFEDDLDDAMEALHDINQIIKRFI